MNTTAREPREWLNNLARPASNFLANQHIDWLDTLRAEARKQLNEQIIPHKKQEAWRYSNVENLFKGSYQAADENVDAIQLLDIDEFFISEIETHRVVMVNGVFSAELSNIENLPAGVHLGSLSEAIQKDPDSISEYFKNNQHHDQHIFSALNTTAINDGLFLQIDEGIHLQKPVEIINLNLSVHDPVIIQPRNICVVKQGASATIIDRFVSTGDSQYFNNNQLEITLEQDASLTHYRLQQESLNACHLGSVFVSQQASSEYRNSSFSLGASWSRTEFNVDFQGQYAQCHLQGLYIVGDNQMQDFHLNIRHDIPNCSSSENFKGILYGKGKAVFDGLIYVAKDAQKTDAHLSNKNLMLSRQAEIDSKPQLEIYADDVQCSHGTTIGELEQQQIFYLRSRGITESKAKAMLCLGFAGEIINNIEITSLKQQLLKQVQQHILPETRSSHE